MALRFAREGDIVVACVRNPSSAGAKELLRLATTEQLPLRVVRCDVTSDIQVRNTVALVLREFGRVDVLVNNAGYGYLGPVEDAAIADIRSIHETNVLGVIRMTQAVIPHMRRQRSGLIVNFSSINGLVPFPLFSVYSATKYAVETFTEGLRFELRHFGIRVVVIEPGSFATGFTENRKIPSGIHRAESPYAPLVRNFLTRYKATHSVKRPRVISKIADPQQVVEAVYRISLEQDPGLRHLIGTDAWLYFLVRKLVPFRAWEWLLSRAYNW